MLAESRELDCWYLVPFERGSAYRHLPDNVDLIDEDWEFLEMLGARGPQKVFVLTKCDRVKPALLAKSAAQLGAVLRAP